MAKEEEGEEGQNPVKGSFKGKSCKGCLYYSTLLKSKARNPLCVGVTRTLPQVPSYIIGDSEVEASKEGRSLSDFKYACVGYSVILDNKDDPAVQQDKQAELPFCVGIELLVDKRASAADHVPAHVHNREDDCFLPQPRPYKPPPHAMGEEFVSRFTRNAGLVASGVARNMNRVCVYVKDSFDDILYTYRRRPKKMVLNECTI
ncbi:uncharacterized protein LOC143854891 [Tasmannia lanceolata]|uniref:uncharacterized protein LOC143854891 n=1 Tax=Tasmannia lanceolata TaxID=3420 RepID=UPI004063CADD